MNRLASSTAGAAAREAAGAPEGVWAPEAAGTAAAPAAGAASEGGLGFGSNATSLMTSCLCPTVPDMRMVTVLQNLSNFIHQLNILARLRGTVRGFSSVVGPRNEGEPQLNSP